MGTKLHIRDNIEQSYGDVYTPEAIAALEFMSRFNGHRKPSWRKGRKEGKDATRPEKE